MSKRIRYAVVGLGWVGQSVVLPAFKNAASNSELTAIVSNSKEKLSKLGEHYKVPELVATDDYEALLKSGKIDAVYLTNGNEQHESYARLAAEAGIHVLCEKPMAVTEESCRLMNQACRKADVKFMVAYRLHLHPAFLSALEIAQSGKIGNIRLFESLFVEPIPEGDARLDRKNGVGPLDYIGIYCINAARTLFNDEPSIAMATQASDGTQKFSQVPEMVSVNLQFPRGRMANFTCGFNSEYRAHFRVIGTKGDVLVERAYAMKGEMTVTLTRNGKFEKQVFEANDQFGAEISYFSDCILKNKNPQPSGLEGLADVGVLRALERSLEINRPVSLSSTYPAERPDPRQAMNFPPIEKPLLVGVSEPF